MTKFSMLAIIAAVSFACSKVPYASFGGGPKKMTALPSRNYYAHLDQEKAAAPLNGIKPVTAAGEAAQSIEKQEVTISENLKAVASGKKLTFTEKIAVAREVSKIRQELKKTEKVSEAQKPSEGGKSQIVALILAIVIGGLGIHRFYLGYTAQGIIQLLTAGGCGIWALIDIIRIAMGELKPKGGDYDQKF